MQKQCLRSGDCALFKGNINLPEDTKLMYKCYYCVGQDQGWETCRRYQMMEMAGFCPDFVMPNSLLSAEQIKNRLSSIYLSY